MLMVQNMQQIFWQENELALTVHTGLKWLASLSPSVSCTGGVASVMFGCRLSGNFPLVPPYIASVP
jgi:hypothetical protein